MRYLSLLFFVISINCYSQTVDYKNFITKEFNFSFRNFEIFHGFSYARKISPFQVVIGLRTGIKSSYFQQNLFPQLTTEIVYQPIKHISKKNNILLFGPSIQTSYSFQKVFTMHQFWNSSFGYNFSFGKRYRFVHTLNAGPLLEKFKGNNNQRVTASSLNYNISIGLMYAFN